MGESSYITSVGGQIQLWINPLLDFIRIDNATPF